MQGPAINVLQTAAVAAQIRDDHVFWGGAATAIGSLGVVVTALCYALSPPEAAMPVLPLDLGRAIAGAVAGAATMHLAGAVGIISDVVLTAAALTIAAAEAARGRLGASVYGWLAIAVSAIIFISVDTLVGFVLGPLATAGAGSFLGFKLFFDTLFALGTFVFGLGGALVLGVAMSTAGRYRIARWIGVPALLFAGLGLIAGLASLMGLDAHQPLGLSIAGGAIAFSVVGVTYARSARA